MLYAYGFQDVAHFHDSIDQQYVADFLKWIVVLASQRDSVNFFFTNKMNDWPLVKDIFLLKNDVW